MRDNNRIVREFGWGIEFVDEHANGVNPHEFFREYSRKKGASAECGVSHPLRHAVFLNEKFFSRRRSRRSYTRQKTNAYRRVSRTWQLKRLELAHSAVHHQLGADDER